MKEKKVMQYEDAIVRNENMQVLICPLRGTACTKNCAWFNSRVMECAVLNLDKAFRRFEMDFDSKSF
nr:MAG TPA: Nemertide alpha-1, Lineus Longissimus, toxin, inhibitor [Caudoviricetes sp.]